MDAVLTIRVGAMGSGKTYGTVHDIIGKYAQDRVGPIIHNLPLHHEKICELARVPGLEDRLIKIDDETVKTWKTKGQGPWSFTRERFLPAELAGGMIILDEVHHCMGGQRYGADHNQHWLEWLSMVRHEQCEVVLITQTFSNFPKWVRDLCECKVEIGSVFGKRLPWFLGGITVGDLRQLWAGLLRTKLTTGAWLLEYRRIGSRWSLSEERPMTFKQEVFEAYESHSATDKGTGGAERVPEPCERFGRVGITWWFLKRNWHRLGPPLVLFSCLIGLPSLSMWMSSKEGRKTALGIFESFIKSQKPPKVVVKKPEPVGQVPAETKPPDMRISAIEKLEVKPVTSSDVGSEKPLPGPVWEPPEIVGISQGRLIDENGNEYRPGDLWQGQALAWVGNESWSWSNHPVQRLQRKKPAAAVDASSALGNEDQPQASSPRTATNRNGAVAQSQLRERASVGGVPGARDTVQNVNRGLR